MSSTMDQNKCAALAATRFPETHRVPPPPTLIALTSGCAANSKSICTFKKPMQCKITTTHPNTMNNNNNYNNINAPKKSGSHQQSSLRQLLPIAVCLLTFATVLSMLVIYMDTTAIRHQQFRLNMSRDYDLKGVRQDDPTLLTFIREIHLKKYPMPFMKNAPVVHTNFSDRHDVALEIARLIGSSLSNKKRGFYLQSLPAGSAAMSTAPWLTETLDWGGIIVEPEPRNYFELRKQNAHRSNVQIVHACISPSGYPKEVTLHHEEENEVRINSLLDEEAAWFNSRVKCFPLFTLMLAVNHTEIDLLSLGCQGQELQILETVPFHKVHIRLISIHLQDLYYHEGSAVEGYAQGITRFLLTKSYRLIKTIDHNYIYQMLRHTREPDE